MHKATISMPERWKGIGIIEEERKNETYIDSSNTHSAVQVTALAHEQNNQSPQQYPTRKYRSKRSTIMTVVKHHPTTQPSHIEPISWRLWHPSQ